MQSNVTVIAFSGSDFANLDTQGCDAIHVSTDTTGRSIRGIVRGGFRDGEQIFLLSEGPDEWTLTDDDASATAGNRIYIAGGDKTFAPGPPFWLVYNETGHRGAGWYAEGTTTPCILAFGAGGGVSVAAVRYLYPYNDANAANSNPMVTVIPFACVAREAYMRTTGAGTGTGTIDFDFCTVDNAGAVTTTGVVVNYDVDSSTLTQSDTTHSVLIPAGTSVTVRSTPQGTVSVSPTRPNFSIALYPI